MEILSLYITCVLIWGSTWFAITYQLAGDVAPEVSVFYRFMLAALITFGACLLTSARMKFNFKDHLWFALQGLFMFCLNYIFTYISESMISSGLVAVTFTLMIYFNIIGMKVFFGQKAARSILLGAFFGGVGILCLFSTEILSFQSNPKAVQGLGIGIFASLLASLGNMASIRARRRNYPVMPSNAYGMFYGSVITGIICLVMGKHFPMHFSAPYLGSLLYLAFFGSFVAFGCYISLLGKIGPERASYVGILTPIIALVISTFFESFHWHVITFVGVAFSLLGNIIVLNKKLKTA